MRCGELVGSRLSGAESGGFGILISIYRRIPDRMDLSMIQNVEAVYEHGVLRPLEPLSLAESQRVKLTISDVSSGRSQPDLGLVERARVEIADIKIPPTIEEVRSALSSIPGSLSQEVIAERGDF
jgi:predicted DNA-binding antitoxin AbrB/MazE fold protein